MTTGLVSQHQLSAYANPQAGQAGTASVVLGNDNTTVTGYNTHDADPSIHVQSSAIASRPAAAAAGSGAKWMSFDTGPSTVRLFYSDASSWTELNYFGSAVTFAAAVTFGSSVTIAGAILFSGAATFASTVGIAGAVTMASTVGIAGATTVAGLITASAGLTIASGQTLTVTGATITGLTAGSVVAGTFPGASYTFTGTVVAGGMISTTNGNITLARTGGAQATFTMSRSGGSAVDWIVYIPAGSTDIRFLDSITSTDRFTLTVGGVGTFAGGLVVTTGGATINGAVSGITTLAGSGAISGFTSMTLSSTVGIAGAATFASTVGIAGATTLAGVTMGAASMTSTVGIAGVVTMASTVGIATSLVVGTVGVGLFKFNVGGASAGSTVAAFYAFDQSTSTNIALFGNSDGTVQYQIRNTSGTTIDVGTISNHSVRIKTNDTVRATYSASGFAIAAGLNLQYGQTAVASVATASTHKIQVVDAAGVTYSVLATT